MITAFLLAPAIVLGVIFLTGQGADVQRINKIDSDNS